MHASANRTDVPDKSRWVRASGICRWDAIQSRHVRAHHTTRTHTFLKSEHQTSKQKIPTESLQWWIPPPSTFVLCERGWVTGLSGNPRSQCACANGGACVRVRGRFGVCNRRITFLANLYQWPSDDDELKKVGSFSAICLSAKPNVCAEISAEFVVLFPTGLKTLSQSYVCFFFLKNSPPLLFFFKKKKIK